MQENLRAKFSKQFFGYITGSTVPVPGKLNAKILIYQKIHSWLPGTISIGRSRQVKRRFFDPKYLLPVKSNI